MHYVSVTSVAFLNYFNPKKIIFNMAQKIIIIVAYNRDANHPTHQVFRLHAINACVKYVIIKATIINYCRRSRSQRLFSVFTHLHPTYEPPCAARARSDIILYKRSVCEGKIIPYSENLPSRISKRTLA